MAEQGNVISRRQVLAHGADDDFIRCRLRRREWARVHNGVYVDHTGRLTWTESAWAAILFYWPAALSHESALRAHGLPARLPERALRRPRWTTIPGDERISNVLHVAVSSTRRLDGLPGVQLHRTRWLPTLVSSTSGLPRVNLERSLLDVAASALHDFEAVAVLGDACQCRRTTPRRLLEVLAKPSRFPRRQFLREVLRDVETGTYSALEHRYLTRVERPHALPTGHRQRRVHVGSTVAYRDVEYVGLHTVVELDGRLGHEAALDRWADISRDVSSAVSGDTTLRIGWRQMEEPCRVALAVARVLRAHGWTGQLVGCNVDCPANS